LALFFIFVVKTCGGIGYYKCGWYYASDCGWIYSIN